MKALKITLYILQSEEFEAYSEIIVQSVENAESIM